MTRNTQGERTAIELRGTVPAEHPLNEQCYDIAPRTAFRMLLTLAEEAQNIRNGLTRLITDEHPLHSTLMRMTPQEALAFLIGLTRVEVKWKTIDPASTVDADASCVKNKPVTHVAVTSIVSTSCPLGFGSEIEFDDADFMLLSSKPG